MNKELDVLISKLKAKKFRKRSFLAFFVLPQPILAKTGGIHYEYNKKRN
jgi:hypothetical protein